MFKKLNFFIILHEEQLRELAVLNKTYTKRKIKDDVEYTDEYKVFLTKIKNYDINKFEYIEFGDEYYFNEDDEYSPILFVYTENEAISAYKKFVHPQYSINYKTPSTNRINIEICKFELKN